VRLRADLPVDAGELDQPRVAARVGLPACRLHREARLPDAPRTRERDQPGAAEQRVHLLDRSGPADQFGDPGGEVGAGAGGRRRAGQRRILRQDRLLQGGELGAGFEPELVDQPSPQHGETREGLGGPPRPVERAHVHGTQPLP
jgi:hypothetical protein